MVWLLVESGDKARDDAAAKLLEVESKRLEKSLELPEAAPDDPQMRTELPLKIAFSTIRVSRNDPAEQMLVRMLLHIDESVSAITGPIAFGVFGRGRALPPLAGEQLTAEIIEQVGYFVTGACSCEVKSLNPGFDLLVAADWDALLEGRVVKDPELPPLIGMSQFAAAPTNPPPPATVATNVAAEPPARAPLKRNLLLALGAGVVLLGVGTVLLKSKGTTSAR